MIKFFLPVLSCLLLISSASQSTQKLECLKIYAGAWPPADWAAYLKSKPSLKPIRSQVEEPFLPKITSPPADLLA